jgi:hypothetical protein
MSFESSSGIAAIQARVSQIRSQFQTTRAIPLGSTTPGAPTAASATTGGELSTELANLTGLAGTTTGTAEFETRLRQILARSGVSHDGTGVGGMTTPTEATDTQNDYVPTGGTLGPSGVDHVRFARDLLARLQLPQTAENIRAIDAWARAEGTRATNNPLATTQGWENATRFNSVGVRNYQSYEDGLAATARTITNGYYPNIIAALRDGSDAMAVARAIAASPWGTGHGVERVLAGQNS